MQKGDMVRIVLHPDLSEGEQVEYIEDHGHLWLIDERSEWYHDGKRDIKHTLSPAPEGDNVNWLWWCKSLATGAREQWYVLEMVTGEQADAEG